MAVKELWDDLVPQELEDSERRGSRPHSKHNCLRRAQDADVVADLRCESLPDEVVQDSEVRDHPVVRIVADLVPRVCVTVLVHKAPIRVRLRVIRVYLHTLPFSVTKTKNLCKVCIGDVEPLTL